jgi:aromatic-L-amino-acid/L-tryptophan decarboxylase
MADKLALRGPDFRALARTAAELVTSYYESLPDRPILEPTSSEALRNTLREPLPREGAGFDILMATVQDVLLRYTRHNGHPRFFGYVASPGTGVGAIGSMIEAALNANVTSWRSAPAPTELEHVVIDWIKEMLGYPAEAAGLLVSGGSMANFAGLAAARSFKAPEVTQEGMPAGGKRMRFYCSGEAHFSVQKAAAMLGVGESNVRTVPTDSRLRMDVSALDRAIAEDLAAGHLPACVVASLGTVGAGAVDPLREIAAVAQRHGLWLHVDAAYGGFAALAPSARPFFDGIGLADSVALDPHKWLYLPAGCGCVLYKEPAAARRAFSHGADYINVIGHERDEAFAFWDYGPELSRPFRALNLWLLLKYAGAQRLGEAIESNIRCAKKLEALVNASGDFEMLAPVTLSIFCFRYAPKNYTGDLDTLNERTLIALQRAGNSYVSNARVQGRFALRGCVLNYRTTERDMELLLEDVREAARKAAQE